MAESIRTLTIKLGYDVDTTGANILKSSFVNLQKSLDRLSTNYEKSIGNMGKANRRFVITAGDLANGIKKIFDVGKKVFVAFADIQQARVTLAFRTSQEEADNLIKRVGEITKATGGYVSQLDALNAVSFGGNMTGQMSFFIDNLDKIIKLSKVAGTDFKETSDAIANFITTGQGLDRLVEFKVITAAEREAIELSGMAGIIGKEGITARTGRAERFLEVGAPRVEKSFLEFQKTGGAALDQLNTSAENLNIVVGQKLNPVVTDVVKDMTRFLNSVKKGTLISDRLAETGEQFDKDLNKVKSFFGVGKKNGVDKSVTSQITNRNSQTSQQTSITDQSTTVINVNGAGDPEKVAKKVMEENNRKVIQSSLRKTTPQSLNTSIIPAESP
jgi:hypothetical protein